MKKYKEQSIWFPVLRCGIQIFWTGNFTGESIAYTTTFGDNGVTNPQIYFNISKPIPITTISHELLHAVRDILHNRGFSEMAKPNDETLTYHHSYCLGLCLDYVKKKGIKICNKVEDMEKSIDKKN